MNNIAFLIFEIKESDVFILAESLLSLLYSIHDFKKTWFSDSGPELTFF